MTLVSEIIRDAYRESNLIAISANPTDPENAEALRFLNRFVSGVYGNEAGEELKTILIGSGHIRRPQGYPFYDQVPDQTTWFLPQNVRMVLNLTAPQKIALDPNPQDGQRFAFVDVSGNLSTNNLTIDGNGRKIDGGFFALYQTDGYSAEYMYRADLGVWLAVTPLLLTSTMPFQTEFDDMFVIAVAMRLNPRHAVTMDPQSSAVYAKLMRQFTAQYRQHQEVGSELGLLRLVGLRGRRHWDDTNYATAAFNSGQPYPFGNRII